MVGPLLKGLSVTFAHLFKRSVTVRYPYKKRAVAPIYRGRHVLKLDEDGREKCCACGLCEEICPVGAIRLYGKEDPEFKYSNVGKIAEIYELDYNRCIFCGFCVEACPRGAIVMTQEYELTEPSRENLVYTKEMLLEKRGGEAS